MGKQSESSKSLQMRQKIDNSAPNWHGRIIHRPGFAAALKQSLKDFLFSSVLKQIRLLSLAPRMLIKT